MDQQRQRIQDDLRGLIAGEVRCDDLTRAMYASDGGVYEIEPLGVVCPRHVADVVACVRYAAENRLPIHARGGGTGLCGGCLGPGLVLDLSRHMRRIVSVDDDTVRVQAGVIHAGLNANLAARGRVFGPDPANSSVTTMGSVVALDASGSHFLRYGSARSHVVRLQAVLPDGTVIEAGREPLSAGEDSDSATNRKRELIDRLSQVLLENHELIEKRQPPHAVNRGGYRLGGIVNEGRLDLASLLCGSQGTLAIITEATLATDPAPAHVGVALLLFDRLENAARAVEKVLPVGPSACDLLDRRHLGLARESDVRFDLLVPATVEAALVVECHGASAAELRERLAAVTYRARDVQRLAIDARQTIDPTEIALYWQLATRVVPRLHRLRGGSRPIPFVEDVVVPPHRMPEFVVALQNVLKQRQVTASLYGHVGHGRLHIRPFLDLSNDDDVGKMRPLAEELYRTVMAHDGWIGGELGDGLSRTAFLRMRYGALCDVFADVKRAFDPLGILNPGKIVGDDPDQLTTSLRAVKRVVATRSAQVETPVSSRAEVSGDGSGGDGVDTAVGEEIRAAEKLDIIDLEMNWNEADVFSAARLCNGCGSCRGHSPDERMCPIFRALPREEASPRAKANLLRTILAGRLGIDHLPSEALKEIADLCVHCHQCRIDCPAGVDICKLMSEAKAAHVAHNGLAPSDWLLTRLDLVGSIAGLVRPLANWALGNRQMRWLLERMFGLAHGRKLPRVAGRSFLRQAAKRKLTRTDRGSGERVLYFVDVYANYFDVQLAEALVAVLEHNGVTVYVPEEPMQSAMAMIAMGAIERAREIASKNLPILADAVRQGFHIVTTEPAAALCLVHEYPNLLADEEASVVAANTTDACGYLWKMHLEKRLRLDFERVVATIGYHQPCMVRALEGGSPGANLLRLVPGLTVRAEEHGCSGMAGTFGLSRANYRTSLRAGWDLISWMRQGPMQAGATECSACKLQMEQGTTKPTVHPIKLLAMAYGLMPELSNLLSAKSSELIAT